MNFKSAPVQFKTNGAGTDDAGTFEAIVSVFGNVDSWGDVVRPGAFTDTITAWKNGADTLPVLWSHRMDDPQFNIGAVLDIAEMEPGRQLPDWVDPHVVEHGGLWVKGRIDTGPDASPIAAQALRLMKARRVTQFSYAYDEVDAGWGKSDGRDVWELRTLRLHEISPTQVGANELTELVGAKAHRAKVRGKALSSGDRDAIAQAIDLLAGVLESDDSGDDDESSDDSDSKASKASSHGHSPESVRESVRLLGELATVKKLIPEGTN